MKKLLSLAQQFETDLQLEDELMDIDGDGFELKPFSLDDELPSKPEELSKDEPAQSNTLQETLNNLTPSELDQVQAFAKFVLEKRADELLDKIIMDDDMSFEDEDDDFIDLSSSEALQKSLDRLENKEEPAMLEGDDILDEDISLKDLF